MEPAERGSGEVEGIYKTKKIKRLVKVLPEVEDIFRVCRGGGAR